MSTLAEELTALKTEEDKITGNKVANFSYDDYAYTNNDANGVDSYNVDAHQNIPNGTASILKVNPTILTKGWRAQASAITRMLMNHFLGRCSYNLNKVNDHFSTLLTKLLSYLGSANGIATLDTNGTLSLTQLPKTSTPTDGSEVAFTAGGAYTLKQAVDGKAPINHASSDTTYGVASTSSYGHAKLGHFSLRPEYSYTLRDNRVTLLLNVAGIGIVNVSETASLALCVTNANPTLALSVFVVNLDNTAIFTYGTTVPAHTYDYQLLSARVLTGHFLVVAIFENQYTSAV